MVENVFGHRGFYLVARDTDSVCGILPLTLVRSRLFGNRMISAAFSNYGGPLTTNPAAVEALYERAVEIAAEEACESIEFRNTEPLPYNLYMRKEKEAMYLPLRGGPENLWRSFRHNIRNRIRKAEKSGLVTRSGGVELLGDFYRIWTIRMRQLGTPCYPRKLFRSVLETFPQSSRIVLAQKRGGTIGAVFVHWFNDLTEIPWGAALVEDRDLCTTTFLWWSVAKQCSSAGATFLDLGRSTIGSGQYEFKRRWGAVPVPLSYQYRTLDGHRAELVTSDNPRYKSRIELWKRMPLWMTRLVGPRISQSLP